ncbi:MAG: hypothetical protein ACOYMR_03480 [Ilumatobacteraceae bacterium]
MEQRNWPGSRDELEGGPIQVRVASVEQIFNPMDPTPLEERSLNIEVADWIEEWAEDLDADVPITIEVLVGDQRLAGREDAITDGIHNHFEYREWQAGRQLRKLLREGRNSLVIGVFALIGFNVLAHFIGKSEHPALEVAHEAALVLGWVSMWKPTEIFLYEWWPIRRELQALRRLSSATVTFPAKPTPRPGQA